MLTEVIIPYAGDCSHRARALAWVQDQLRSSHPGWKVTVAAPPAGPWRKAAAVMPAVTASRASVVAVVDADVWTDGLGDAVERVAAGAPWAIPHRSVRRLSCDGTAAALAGEPLEAQPLAERAYRGVAGGGVVVGRREVLLDIPLDPRFAGWGQEDESWAAALHVLAGPAWRGTAPLFHLWHPPQARMSRRRGSTEGWDLRSRYFNAQHDPGAMRALVEEAKHAALQADEPALHAPAA